MPAPLVVPMPAPMPRPVTIPELAIAPMAALAPMAFELPGVPQVVVDSTRAREIAREAADRARFELINFNRDWNFDFNFDFQYGVASSQDGDYVAGKEYVFSRKYEQAIVRFDRVLARKGSNIDGALYWKAYSQFKLGKSDESLATIAQLRKDHAQSRYLSDAKVLEADARKMAGQPVNPADADTDQLKLLAISSLQHSDAERAIPLLEGVLNANNSPAVKKHALYILALNPQPRAYQVLLNYAKGAGNPDLQLEAIRYITANRNKLTSSKDLLDIYQNTQDNDVKLAIISALRSSQNTAALTQIVSSGSTPVAIRSSALSGLSGILSPQDLWTLYEKEQSKELRMQMISAFASMQAMDQLSRVIKIEKDPEVRRRVLRSLGNLKSDKTGQMLVDLYAGEQDADSKRQIISSLYSQGNAEGLVSLARKEPTLALKTEIVRRLSEMAPKSKVAADYLIEIIK
jgi:hypothetical protein